MSLTSTNPTTRNSKIGDKKITLKKDFLIFTDTKLPSSRSNQQSENYNYEYQYYLENQAAEFMQ
jgi:hypothetical protein